jgi:hypothetical protein
MIFDFAKRNGALTSVGLANDSRVPDSNTPAKASAPFKRHL